MFKFLKDKIRETVNKFSSNVEKEIIEEEKVIENDKEVIEDSPKIVKQIPKEIKKEKVVEKIQPEETKELSKKVIEEEKPIKEVVEEAPKEIIEEKPVEEKKGFFKRLFSKKEIVEEVPKEELVSEILDEEIAKEETPVELVEEKLVEETKEEILPEESIKEEKVVVEKKPQVKRTLPEKKSVEEVEIIKEDIVEAEDEPLEKVVEESKEEHSKKEKIEINKNLLDEEVIDATKKKKGFFAKIKETFVKFKLDDDKFEELFWDFELGLLESNVAVSVIEKIKNNLKEKLTTENVSKKGVEEVISNSLKESFENILSVESFDLIEKIKKTDEKPYVICMIGVNGSGKTTTIAKLIQKLQKNDISLVVAASDTFRAAAIDQLEEHTNKLGVKLIKHDYNADPAAVAFDAIKHAKAKNMDVVLIDTAGRLHSNTNLMDELKKVVRVSNPDLKIFIGESTTGNDCVEQATEFDSLIGIDAIILSKADVDENGGAAISVSYVTKKPILYLGTGQGYDDLVPFDKNMMLQKLGFE